MELFDQVFTALKGLGNAADKKLRAPQDEYGNLITPFKPSNQILFDEKNETSTWICVNEKFVARALFTSVRVQCLIIELPAACETGVLNSGDSWLFLKSLSGQVSIALDNSKAPYKMNSACYAQLAPDQEFDLKNLSNAGSAQIEIMRHRQSETTS